MLSPILLFLMVAHATELPVQLFGSPCMLQGPVDEKTLRAIHAISPDQITPEVPQRSSKGVTRALDSVKKDKSPHPSLDRYRDKLIARLEGQAAFWRGYEGFLKNKNTAAWLALVKPFLRPGLEARVAASLRGLASANFKKPEDQEKLHAAFDVVCDAIEPDPEEEFHRAIGKLKVQYRCSYDGGGDAAADPATDATTPEKQP